MNWFLILLKITIFILEWFIYYLPEGKSQALKPQFPHLQNELTT